MSDTEILKYLNYLKRKRKVRRKKSDNGRIYFRSDKWKFLTINLKKIFNDSSLEQIKWTDPGDRFVKQVIFSESKLDLNHKNILEDV